MKTTKEEEFLFIPGNERAMAVCSDNSCPCPQVPIPRNSGYFFIEKRLNVFVANITCEQGARLRNLDLESAHQDAKMWWRYGRVPARESIKNYKNNQNAPFENIQTGDVHKAIDRIRREALNSIVDLEQKYFGSESEESKHEKKPEFVRDKNGYFFDSKNYSRFTYPEIFIPDGVKVIQQGMPSSKFVAPTKPIYKSPVNRGLFVFWIVILVVVVGMVAEGDNISGNLLIAAIMFIFGTTLINLNFRRKKKNSEQDYQEQIKRYEQDFDRFLEKQKVEFGEQHIREWRTQKIKDFFKGSIVFYEANKKAPKGKAEDYFHKHLIDFFGNEKIITDVEVGDFDRPYKPDFVYYDKNNGLKIDIEVDELYSFFSKDPIHYYYLDDKRNQYFTSKRWCVIRFSEEQVINYPERCCKVIHQELKKLNLHNPFLSQKFQYTADLPPYNKWEKEEAEKLMKQNFREFILDDRFFKNFEKQKTNSLN